MRTHPILAITQEGRQEEEERAAAKKARARARKEREDLAADRALVAEMESAEREQVEAFGRWQEAREREARQAAVNQTREALERRRGEITPTQP
jgi:alpha-galactosidase